MVREKLGGGILCLTTVVRTHIANPQVLPDDQAPMFRGVDENMRLVDMADFVDGRPLLFLYNSATWQLGVLNLQEVEDRSLRVLTARHGRDVQRMRLSTGIVVSKRPCRLPFRSEFGLVWV